MFTDEACSLGTVISSSTWGDVLSPSHWLINHDGNYSYATNVLISDCGHNETFTGLECLGQNIYKEEICVSTNASLWNSARTFTIYDETCANDQPVYHHIVYNESKTTEFGGVELGAEVEAILYVHYQPEYLLSTDTEMTGQWMLTSNQISVNYLAVCQQEDLMDCTENNWRVKSTSIAKGIVDILDTQMRASDGPCGITKSPSGSPTRPSQQPTNEPTHGPTIAQCQPLYVEITNFRAFTADELESDWKLQLVVANITHHAIAQYALEYNIDSKSFNVVFLNVSGTLFIEEILCAPRKKILTVLDTVIDTENDEINTTIEQKLKALFPTENDEDQPSVMLYLPIDEMLNNTGTVVENTPTLIHHGSLKWIIGSAVLGGFFFILGVWHCLNQIKIRRHWANTLQIKNGLIVSIGIGKYGPRCPEANVSIFCPDLLVEADVENLKKLSEFLHYDFLTAEDKLSWTKDEVMEFLVEDVGAHFFDEKGYALYDGLIVAISSHGMHQSIISSDYQMISRTDIHRCISEKYPQIRKIPRIFLFDACDGTRDRKATAAIHAGELGSGSKYNSGSEDAAKGPTDVTEALVVDPEWTSRSKNPDYNLIVVHGSNDGFVSKMNESEVGSYLTYSFAKAVKYRIEKKQRKGLSELLTDIQNQLHDMGKQLIKFNCYNNTANMRIERAPSRGSYLKFNRIGDVHMGS